MSTVPMLRGADPGQNDGGPASKEERAAAPSGKLDYQTDLFTGRFGYSVPLQLAPGRHGSEPRLALKYNSGNDNGWCGFGWELDLGYIQRETRKGVPVKWGNPYPLAEYDDGKGFTFSLGGQSAALVNVSGNEYRAEIESGFVRFNLYSTNTWVAVDKSGNKYFFGQTAASRMVNPKGGWSSTASSACYGCYGSRYTSLPGHSVGRCVEFKMFLPLTSLSLLASVER